MSDLFVGLGIALVLEGLLWALAPNAARRMLAEMAKAENSSIQITALIVVAIGVLIVWLARG